MYVYRAMSSTELLNRMKGIETNAAIIKGVNSFQYEEGKDYMHFYKFAKHAFFFQQLHHLAVVAKVQIREELLPPLEYGFYGGIETEEDDSLYGYYIPLPEIIVERNLIDTNSFVKFFPRYIPGVEVDEEGKLPPTFWVEKEIEEKKKSKIKELFSLLLNIPEEEKQVERQYWDNASIYYEYVKSLIREFEGNSDRVLSQLKEIDLDQELDCMREKVKENKVMTKRQYPRQIVY